MKAKVSALGSFDTVSEPCGLVTPPGCLTSRLLSLCSSGWETWHSGALCASVTPLPLHFPNVNILEACVLYLGEFTPQPVPGDTEMSFGDRLHGQEPAFVLSVLCRIECLGQARGLHCYSAGPTLQTPLEASLRVMVWKRPFQACQKVISLYLRGCRIE